MDESQFKRWGPEPPLPCPLFFGGMLKNEKEKKESVITKQALIAELQVDVGNYDVIKRILIIYLALVAIPSYQKQAKERYIM